jgi:hypothetical protein
MFRFAGRSLPRPPNSLSSTPLPLPPLVIVILVLLAFLTWLYWRFCCKRRKAFGEFTLPPEMIPDEPNTPRYGTAEPIDIEAAPTMGRGPSGRDAGAGAGGETPLQSR